MRRLDAAQVRSWRARRWYLSTTAHDAATAVAAVLPLPASPSAYLSLLARVRGFHATDLDRLIFEERSLRPYPLWRTGPLLVPVEMIAVLEATHLFRARAGARRSRVWRRREAAYADGAPAAADFLTATPRTIVQLADVGALEATAQASPAALRQLLDDMAGRGEATMTLAGPSLLGAQPAYADRAGADHIPRAPTESYDFLVDLAIDYFRRAGPATRDDFVWWASISYASARHSIEDLAGLLEEVDIEGERKAHFMAEDDAADLRAARVQRGTRASFLPADDPAAAATEKGFQALSDPDLASDFAPRARRTPVGLRGRLRPLLVGGLAVGTWAWDPAGQRVATHLKRDLDASETQDVEEAAEQVATFLCAARPAAWLETLKG